MSSVRTLPPRSPRGMPLGERLLSMVVLDPDTGCLLWDRATNEKGYGYISVNGRMRRAHIVAWELWVGPVPEGLVLDHFVCSRRACIIPRHLKPSTQAANLHRSPLVIWNRRKREQLAAAA